MIKDYRLLLLYIYIFLPSMLFFATWFKPIYALIFTALSIVGIYLSYKNDTPLIKLEKDKKTIISLLFVLFIIVTVVLTSGIGSSIAQYPDHLYRNAVFKTLIDHEWPVALSLNGTSKVMTYYIGYWLPAALVAKVSSYQMGFLFLQIWAVIGLWFIYRLIVDEKKKVRIWFLIVFLLFGGADYIGYVFIGKIFNQVGNSYEWWAYNFNYPGFFTQLFWAYNQVIYGLIIHQMIMRQKCNKNILFIWMASLINSPFPAIGMIPFAVYRAIKNSDDNKINFIKAVTDSISIQNVIGLVLSVVCLIYLSSNLNIIRYMSNSDIAGNVISLSNEYLKDLSTTTFGPYQWTTKLYNYLWFVLLEFGLYYIVLYKKFNNNSFYWLTLVVLLLCPLIEIGGWIDFCMRGSIPALYCLYMMLTDSLEDYLENKNYLLFACLILLLAISSLTCKETLVGVMQPTAQAFYEGKTLETESFSEEYIFKANNFFGTTDSIFYKYFAK